MIRFLLNNDVEQIRDVKADTTLLNYLREKQNLTGTKEGCASGDCGACTVVLAQPNQSGDKLEYAAVNSCVTFLSALQGKQLITVEGLQDKGTLHPVQQAMVDHHGSQCGFCTPGFVMSMFAMYQQNTVPDREQVNVALSGNLCRCTGYRPIVDAAMDACSQTASDQFTSAAQGTLQTLQNFVKEGDASSVGGLHMPTNRTDLKTTIEAFPEARLFAGSTDLALEVTQQLKDLDQLISLSRVNELNVLTNNDEGLFVGAALPLNKIEAPLLAAYPELSELIERFASTPIRNQATLGGNVANASPIGDMPPVLIALNAQICVDNGESRRRIPANTFFTGYRQTQLAKDEWIEGILFPARLANTQVRAYKISKRFEDDISAVCAVFNMQLEDGNIQSIHAGFGGVAATPEGLSALAGLAGKTWSDKATCDAGKTIISQAFTPIDDVRATAAYRQTILLNLWQRFWSETNYQEQAIPTRVIQHVEASHA